MEPGRGFHDIENGDGRGFQMIIERALDFGRRRRAIEIDMHDLAERMDTCVGPAGSEHGRPLAAKP